VVAVKGMGGRVEGWEVWGGREGRGVGAARGEFPMMTDDDQIKIIAGQGEIQAGQNRK